MQRTPVLLEQYTAPDYWIDTVDLVFSLSELHTTVVSTLHMRRNLKKAQVVPLILQGEMLTLEKITLDGVPLSENQYACTETTLTIPSVPDEFVLVTSVQIEPQNNTALSGLYRAQSIFCTQCEAEGFRRITYYLDRPDVMAKFTTTIIADAQRYPVLLSNGNCISRQQHADGRLEVVWSDPHLKPCYLFALVAGDLACVKDYYTTATGRHVALEFYAEAPYVHRCDAAIQALKHAMQWDEETYGLSYDLDIYMVVAVSSFNMGAMENKGLNIFNTKYVLGDLATATDTDFQNIESVIGHEYFHNWTGNRVTCRDWFQLSLKEGLTVFREQQFSQAMGMGAVKRIQDVNLLRNRQFQEDAGPLAHPVRPCSYMEINNFYTSTIYNKGAEVIRMQHTLLGDAGFKKGMALYFARHDGQAVTTDDFVDAMADANQVDLSQFKRWYTQAGTPEVVASLEYDAQKKKAVITMTQSCPVTPDQKTPKLPFVIPIVTTLLNAEGECIASDGIKDNVYILKDARQSFVIENIESRPIPALLGGFSAPVRLKYDYTEKELGLLIAKAPDPFNKWDAAQQWFTQYVFGAMHAIKTGQAMQMDTPFFSNFHTAMQDKRLDPAFIGKLITLPNLLYLSEQMNPVDVDPLVAAFNAVEQAFSLSLKPYLVETYQKIQSNAVEGWTPEGISSRALKNICLRLWVRTKDAMAMEAAQAQYRSARNMTDKIAALVAVNDEDTPIRTALLAEFYAFGEKDPLLMDKWLGLQAVSMIPRTLDVIESLLTHPVFDMKNPNKVYALIGAFAGQNMAIFHRKDGKGYQFLAEKICLLDQINPSVAARLGGYFAQWKKFDQNRQAKMREALEYIQAHEPLSSDLGEVIQKTLE